MALIEGCKHEVEITVPAEEVEREMQHVIEGVQKRAKIPGFRPGKAPVSLIRTKFRQEIRHDVVDHVLPKAFRKRAEEERWKVVGNPNVTHVTYNEGEPLVFKAEFEMAPEFELGEYRDLEVPYAEPQIEEQVVDKRLEELRERKAEFVNEDPRPVVDGDFVVVSLRSIAGVEGEPVQSDNMVLQIGQSDTMPEFTENVRGMTPGDEKDFAVSYPEDYAQPRLAGKSVTFHLELKGVRRKELPELNDEFARDLGDYQSLDELRTAVRAGLRSELEHQAQRVAKEKLVDALVAKHDFPIPEVYLNRQIEFQVERQLREIAEQGIDPRELKLDWERIKDTQRESAARNVKASLLLDRVADVESIDATNEEVDREVQRIAKQEREAVASVRMKLEKDGSIGRIASTIRTEKTLTYLFDNARKVVPPPEEPVADSETPSAE